MGLTSAAVCRVVPLRIVPAGYCWLAHTSTKKEPFLHVKNIPGTRYEDSSRSEAIPMKGRRPPTAFSLGMEMLAHVTCTSQGTAVALLLCAE